MLDKSNSHCSKVCKYVRPDGSAVWVKKLIAPLKTGHELELAHVCLLEDITPRIEMEKDLRESERSKEVLLSNLPGMAYRCKYDRDWTMLYVSQGCYELTGYRAE